MTRSRLDTQGWSHHQRSAHPKGPVHVALGPRDRRILRRSSGEGKSRLSRPAPFHAPRLRYNFGKRGSGESWDESEMGVRWALYRSEAVVRRAIHRTVSKVSGSSQSRSSPTQEIGRASVGNVGGGRGWRGAGGRRTVARGRLG